MQENINHFLLGILKVYSNLIVEYVCCCSCEDQLSEV